MCTTNVFTYIHPDGRRELSHQPMLCSASRYGKTCPNNIVFQHPPQFLPLTTSTSAPGPGPAPYLHAFPPTPTYTPRSGTPNYRSGDDSDRSFHSSSSGRRRQAGIYVNGQRMLDLNSRERRPSRTERIVIVDNPPTPRTPPKTYATPHTAPSSPNPNNAPAPYIIDASPRTRHSYTRRPVIVDERPRVVRSNTTTNAPSGHARHSSTSSYDSRYSYHSAGEEARAAVESRRLRSEARERRRQDEEEKRRLKINERIARANAEIARRPAVPAPMPPMPPRRTSTAAEREADLVDSVRRLSFEEARREEKSRRLEEKADRLEAEAQRKRLLERTMPTRRATVGPGDRRPRYVYDHGVYRWE